MSLDQITPKSSEKSIQDYLRQYYSLSRSSQEFNISNLFELYKLSKPSLHKLSGTTVTDVSVLNYAIPRLPASVFNLKHIIVAQGLDQLSEAERSLDTWELEGAPSRRRQNYYDRVSQTLVVLINSDSDIDDLINCLVAFQLERKKIADLDDYKFGLLINQQKYEVLGIDQNNWTKLQKLMGDNFNKYRQYSDISIRCLPQSETYPNKVASDWLNKVHTASFIFDFKNTPLYFISSNLHSLSNTIGGFVNQRQDYIISHLEKSYPELYQQWQELKNGNNSLRVIDFLYYVSNKYFSDLPAEAKAKVEYEESLGIKNLKINTQLPCLAQIIPISAIAKSTHPDPNLIIKDREVLLNSKAYILNIEYPLGMSAYYILKEMLNNLNALKGIYIIGKAAILSGNIGDIQIPDVVFDERSNNIFHPKNTFNQFFPFPSFVSSILQNQKAISVYGTFLENESQLNNYIATGFNIIEMESGPYLSAIHQYQNKLNAIPQNAVVHLDNSSFDLGIINYASDNPLSQTLGDSVMSQKGVEPTYLAALTTIQRIIDLEST